MERSPSGAEAGTVPSTYTQLYYHLIWATREREAFITPAVEAPLYRYLRARGAELGAVVHAVGGIENHVHVVVSVPPRHAVSDFVHDLKGGSSHLINHLPGPEMELYWQVGYGALSFAKRDLARIVAYVLNQKEHHTSGRTSAEMERCE